MSDERVRTRHFPALETEKKKEGAQKGDVTAPAGLGLGCLCDAARLRGTHTEKKRKKKSQRKLLKIKDYCCFFHSM